MARPEVLVEFARGLRREGIPVGSSAAGDLLHALEAVGAGSAADVYWAFRSVALTSHDQAPAFDRVFYRTFGRWAEGDPLEVAATVTRSWAIRLPEDGGGDDDSDGDGTEEESEFTGASAVERLATKDFAELTATEIAEVRKLIARMVWRPADVRSRRRRPVRSGDRPDLRRTLRRMVGPEGDLLQVATTERKIRRRPLVLIADVSGSMERYTEMLLYFAHATRGRLGRMEAFVFSTRLTRITRELRRRDPSHALREISEAVHDWSGGTRIGEALRTFNRDWSRRVTRGGAIALVVSDGWDRGDPHLLAEEMGRLARSVHRVVWLNPLAGRPGYSPETRGMRAALPHIDDFIASGNLADLATLVRLLESVPLAR